MQPVNSVTHQVEPAGESDSVTIHKSEVDKVHVERFTRELGVYSYLEKQFRLEVELVTREGKVVLKPLFDRVQGYLVYAKSTHKRHSQTGRLLGVVDEIFYSPRRVGMYRGLRQTLIARNENIQVSMASDYQNDGYMTSYICIQLCKVVCKTLVSCLAGIRGSNLEKAEIDCSSSSRVLADVIFIRNSIIIHIGTMTF